MEKEMSLSLRGEFFDEAVKLFDKGLQGAIKDAEDKKMDTVKFTFSGEITLAKADVRDKAVPAYPATREIMKLIIEYKTGFTLQHKTSGSGKLRDDCELVWDEEHRRYLARAEENGQITLFDKENGLEGVVYRVDGRGIVTVDADCAEMDKMLPEPPRQLAPYEEGMNRGFSD